MWAFCAAPWAHGLRGQPLDYQPSSIERLWHNATGRNCDTARHAVGLPAMRSWLEYAKGAVGPTPRMPKEDELAAASKITWNSNCHELIEPLTGSVRHPLSSPWPCKMRTALEQARDEAGSWYHAKYARGHPKEKYNTDHLIIANRCPAQGETDGASPPQCRPHRVGGSGRSSGGSKTGDGGGGGSDGDDAKRRRVLFFDLGCSVFGKMLNLTKLDARGVPPSPVGYGPSIPLFMAMYARNCIEFDMIWGWEARKMTHWWDSVPAALRDKVNFFNFPVNLSRAIDQPLGVLLANARPADFVVLKIDIDTAALGFEKRFVEMIADEPQLSSLVDEIFFEYHLRVDDASPPAKATCGNGFAQNAEGRCDTPTDAIELMQKLRRLGIRSHFWI